MVSKIEYIKAKKVVKEYENQESKLSFWLMRDNHSTAQPKGKTLDEIVESFIDLVNQNPYSCVCPVIILNKEGKEVRRVGKMAHSVGTDIDLTEWRKALESDSDVMYLIKKKAFKH